MGKIMVTAGAALILWAGLAQGNPPDSLWSKTFGGASDDGCHAVVELADGRLALAGTATSFGAGGMEYWLVIARENGDSLMSRNYGAGDCNALIQTRDGGLALGGTRIVETDRNLNASLNQPAEVRAYSMVQDAEGNFALLGMAGVGEGNYDFRLVKFGRWSKHYGGESQEEGFAIAAMDDGGFALAGYAMSYGADKDVWLVRTDAAGDVIWARNYVRSGPDICYSMVKTDDGGFMLAGETTRRGLVADIEFLLMKVNADGDLQWTRCYGKNTRQEGCNSISKTYDGGFILGGTVINPNARDANMWALRVNAEGDSLWSVSLGGRGNENCYSVIQTADGGFALGGYTYSYGSGMGDYWLVKLAAEPVNGAQHEAIPSPYGFSLAPPYPNPFNGVVNLSFRTAKPGRYFLEMVDPSGRSVAKLFDEFAGAGERRIVWDSQGSPAGRYWVRMESEFGETQSAPITLVK